MAQVNLTAAAADLMSARQIREYWGCERRQVAFQRMSSPAFIVAVPVAAVIGGLRFYDRADVERYTEAKKASWR